jgi:hypothetical protein
MVIDNRHGKPFKGLFQAAGTVWGGAVYNNNPAPRPFLPPYLIRKPIRKRYNLGAFERTGGTGDRLFSKPFQDGSKSQLAPYTISIRFFMTNDEKF